MWAWSFINGVWQNDRLGSGQPVAAGTSPGTALVNGGVDVFYPGAGGQMWAWTFLGGRGTNSVLGTGEPVAAVPVPSGAGAPPTNLAPPPRPGRLRVRLVIHWRWDRRHTRLVGLRMLGLPRGTVVTVCCRGRGCPRRRWSATAAGRLRALRHLTGAAFAPRDRLSITLRKHLTPLSPQTRGCPGWRPVSTPSSASTTWPRAA